MAITFVRHIIYYRIAIMYVGFLIYLSMQCTNVSLKYFTFFYLIVLSLILMPDFVRFSMENKSDRFSRKEILYFTNS